MGGVCFALVRNGKFAAVLLDYIGMAWHGMVAYNIVQAQTQQNNSHALMAYTTLFATDSMAVVKIGTHSSKNVSIFYELFTV